MLPPDAEQSQTPDPATSPGAAANPAAGLVPRDPAARATEVIEAPLAPGGVVPRGADRPDLPPALTATPNLFSLLQALRRRWLLAASLAVLFSALAAGVTWEYIAPAKYQASAVIRINSQDPRI